MISFKEFVHAIHAAVLEANNTLMDKNQEILKKYFKEVPDTSDTSKDDPKGNVPLRLEPLTVNLEYPHLDSDGKVELTDISVPLITLAPLNMSQIEKVTFSSEFEMLVNEGELEIDFSNRKRSNMFSKKDKSKVGKIEIVVTPQDTAEGIKILVEAYENVLKRQL